MVRLHAVLAVVTLMLSLLAACGHKQAACHGDCPEDDVRYEQLDSVMGTISNIDSLAALAQQSHEQNDSQGEMLALRHEGNRLRTSSRYAEAIDAHGRGLDLAIKLKDTVEMAKALNCLGEVHRRLGDFSKSNNYYFDVLKLCDLYSRSDDDAIVRIVASSLYGIGNIEMELCNYSEADSLLREALHRQIQLGNVMGQAVNYSALGRVKHDVGEVDSAWLYMRKSLECNQMAGNEKGVALCHLHFGELYEAENNFSHALNEYVMAYDNLKAFGDSWHSLDACLALARIHILLGEEETAHQYLTEAEAEAFRIGSKEYQAEAHLVHYELSLLQGDSQEALRHYVLGTQLTDSISGRQKSDEMYSQHINYQTGRMSGELDVLNRDINQLKRNRNMQIVFLVLLLLMAGGIIAVLMYAMRVRARTQRLMRQVEETRSLFFTNVVHQLRTPLSAIMGAVDGIIADNQSAKGQGVLDDRQQKNCEIIERQGKNLLELVDRILEVGSVRSAITELDWRTGDAVIFMHMLIDSYRDRCRDRHIELTYASRENNVEIDSVPHYLITIVGSLLENAINYSSDYGIITVTSSVEDGMFVIRVADNGMGISKDDLPHVFEPFYRSAIAESMVEGVGIGLTVVRDMTMAMGGTVAVDSKEEHGSVFTVKLPCRQSGSFKQLLKDDIKGMLGMSERHRLEQPQSTIPQDEPQSDKPVVLVVEDHIDVARLVGLILSDKYQVHYAADGEQGFAKAIELMPDLIITDVKMPFMDGVDMCRELHRSPRLCHIPVIILSARNAEADRVRGIQAGADAYLVKPFISEELRSWVENLLESRKRLRAVFAASGSPDIDALPTVATGNGDDAAFLEAFAREVDKHFAVGTKLDFDKLALTFKMGESHLRRKIQDLTGKNVPAYITQLRMEKAMRLLQNSPADVLIGDIASQCGFQDVAYFSRVFRQHYGKTPTQARSGK